ncbi:hypothetical protein ACFX1Q_010506 [Malus domestica]
MSQPAAEATPDIPKSDTTDVLVQYVVLRRDLIDTWPTSSVVTQGCHASASPRVLTQLVPVVFQKTLVLVIFQKAVNGVEIDPSAQTDYVESGSKVELPL